MILPLTFAISLATSLIVLDSLIRKVKKTKYSGTTDLGLLVPDLHRKKKTLVPKVGGVGAYFGIAFGTLISVTYLTFYTNTSSIPLLAMLTSISLITFISFLDDILKISQLTRAIIPAIGALPLIAIKAGEIIITLPIIGTIELGALYYLLVVIGVFGASNATNMLAGYSGISSLTGIITMTGLLAYSLHINNLIVSLFLTASIGAYLAFFYYNLHPARCFPGMADYLVGAVIVNAAVIGGMEKIALYMFPLYFIELALKARKKFKNTWWSKLRKDGRLEPASKIIETLPHLLMKIHGPLTMRRIVFETALIQTIIVTTVLLLHW